MSQRLSLTGLIIGGAAAGVIYLGLIYPVYRIFYPTHGPNVTTSGQSANANNRYGFDSGWRCAGKYLESFSPNLTHTRSFLGSLRIPVV
jgi:hypothetical protein